jgi:hypothetical protein
MEAHVRTLEAPRSSAASDARIGSHESAAVRRAILCLGLTSAVLAGCGGSSSSSTLTHQQLVAKANAICAQRNTSIEALPKSLRDLSKVSTLATYLGRVESIDRPLIAKLKALKPPAADKATWQRTMADNDNVFRAATKAQAAAHAGNAAEVRRISGQLPPLNQKLQADGVHLGLTECLKQPTPSA